MIKRVALARALVRDPEIVLFDEPTTSLDPVASRAVLDLFSAVHQRLGLTGILVSHEIPRIFEIVQRVAMLHEGRIIAVESPGRFCASPEPVIQQFVNGNTSAQSGPNGGRGPRACFENRLKPSCSPSFSCSPSASWDFSLARTRTMTRPSPVLHFPKTN